MSVKNPWPRLYRARRDYVWDTAPTALAREVAAIHHGAPRRARERLLDVGCGEGRDVVFFARRGYDAVGLDVSKAGLDKARRLAAAGGVTPRWIATTIERYRPSDRYDVVFSCGALHYLARPARPKVFGLLKAATRPGGLHAVMVFTDVRAHQEFGEKIEPFSVGELQGFYEDWGIRTCREETITCRVDGTAHEHSTAVVIAERPCPS